MRTYLCVAAIIPQGSADEVRHIYKTLRPLRRITAQHFPEIYFDSNHKDAGEPKTCVSARTSRYWLESCVLWKSAKASLYNHAYSIQGLD